MPDLAIRAINMLTAPFRHAGESVDGQDYGPDLAADPELARALSTLPDPDELPTAWRSQRRYAAASPPWWVIDQNGVVAVLTVIVAVLTVVVAIETAMIVDLLQRVGALRI